MHASRTRHVLQGDGWLWHQRSSSSDRRGQLPWLAPHRTQNSCDLGILPGIEKLYITDVSIERALSADVVPVLVVRTQGVDRTLQAGRSYRAGRDPQSDIVVDEPRVSWLHAILMVEHGRWLLADASSTNGTFVGRDRGASAHPCRPKQDREDQARPELAGLAGPDRPAARRCRHRTRRVDGLCVPQAAREMFTATLRAGIGAGTSAVGGWPEF